MSTISLGTKVPAQFSTTRHEAGAGLNTVPPAPAKARSLRLPFIDNLRWTMIILVVSMHAAVTYSHLGSW